MTHSESSPAQADHGQSDGSSRISEALNSASDALDELWHQHCKTDAAYTCVTDIGRSFDTLKDALAAAPAPAAAGQSEGALREACVRVAQAYDAKMEAIREYHLSWDRGAGGAAAAEKSQAAMQHYNGEVHKLTEIARSIAALATPPDARPVGEDALRDRERIIERLNRLAKDAWVGSVEEWTAQAVLAMCAASRHLASQTQEGTGQGTGAVGYLNLYRDDDGDLVGGSSDLYESAEEAISFNAGEFTEYVGVFALVPVATAAPQANDGEAKS